MKLIRNVIPLWLHKLDDHTGETVTAKKAPGDLQVNYVQAVVTEVQESDDWAIACEFIDEIAAENECVRDKAFDHLFFNTNPRNLN